MEGVYDGDKARLVHKQKIAENEEYQGTFRTKIGLALTCIGCMVGTGNIWRFPRILANSSGNKGCLQFLLIWVLFLFMWSIPMLIIEYSMGRFTKKSSILSYRNMIGQNNMWAGAWIALVALGISSYYSVIVGWCLYYLFYFIANDLPVTSAESNEIFYWFSEVSLYPVLCHFAAISFGAISVAWGVKSIEIANSIIVPIFLVLLLFTFIWSLTLEYAGQGLKFMFSPDWSMLSEPRMWVDAVTQNAFDTGAGSGLFISYAVYMTAGNGIIRYAILVPICNNLISLFCGMLTFSTVFATEIGNGSTTEEIVSLLQENGPGNTGLTFIWMPILYNKISGGRVLMAFFFFSLLLAGFSSLVAQLELFVHNVNDFGLSRKKSTLLMSIIVFLIGLGSALDINFLVNQDFVWGFALLLSGMALQYIVIRYGAKHYRRELINDYSDNDWYLPMLWDWVVILIAPIEAVALIAWWCYDTISRSNPWYALSEESFMITVIEWVSCLSVLLLLNLLYVKWYSRRFQGDETLSLPPANDARSIKSDGVYSTFQETETAQ